MAEPADRESFVLRFTESQLDSRCDLHRGLGLPCPFCAAPNFTKYPIYEVEGLQGPTFALIQPFHPVQTCEECGRSGKFFFDPILIQGVPAQKFYILQTGGPLQTGRQGSTIGWVQ